MAETDTSSDTADTHAPAAGHEVIRAYLRGLDNSPGVYRMLNAAGEVLYVGKARALVRRVSSYARPTGHSARIQRMIAETASMMFLTTQTETEALLLEQNLIKQLKPRYNVLLRDDKSFPDIHISDHDFPRIAKHRGARRAGGDYFGPFASGGAVNRTLAHLERVFMLRNCADTVFANRSRPCLQYQIRRCSAPCVGKISVPDYAASVADARRFLTGRSSQVQARLAQEMQIAAEAMEYERAAALRDRIRALTSVQAVQGVNPQSVAEADIVSLHIDGGAACVQVFFIRANQNWGNRAYFPRTGAGAEEAEILEAFLGQFYGNKVPPRLILLSHQIENPDLMSQALAERAGRRVALGVPQRGERRVLVDNARRNAREELARRMSETASQTRLLADLARHLDLPAPPRRIEVYDNSHLQGSHAVGAMIVAGPDGFIKSAYRKFNFAPGTVPAGDDTAMMAEMLGRRFGRLLKDDPERSSDTWPDLLLIDGGAGQLGAVHKAMDALGLDGIAIVGVAKGEERDAGREIFHRKGHPPRALPHTDPALYFVQRLRDEAHRFVIGAHRTRRAQANTATPLDEVPGIGPARKRALLAHFGSAKAVTRAALADLRAVEGISRAMAETIHAFFNPRQ